LLLAIAVLTLGLSTVASRAEGAISDCDSNQACLWEHAGYGGNYRALTNPGDWVNLTGALNNEGTSARNHKNLGTGAAFRMAEHLNGNGWIICLPAGTTLYSLGGTIYNDDISSLRLTGSC
jgi:hypothetical protein